MNTIRFTLVTVIIIVFSLKVIAEPPSQYELKTASLSDFLTTAQSILSSSSTPQEIMRRLVNVIDTEFGYRYLSNATYQERRRAFDILKKVEFGFETVEYPDIDINEWIAWIVDAWLAENPIDLDAIKEIKFDDFQATLEHRDFNNDGIDEWLLDLTKGADGDYFEYRNWLVIAREGKGYHAIRVPVWPGYHGSWNFPTAYSQQPGETDFKDITADGIPEWLIGREVSPWGNIPGHTYQESILSWQDGRLVNLIPDSNGVQKANLDDDPALELFTDYTIYDSWHCSTITKTVYDWSGTAFVKLGQPVIEKRNCWAREAEEAMWRGDIRTAIQLYNTYLETNQRAYDDYIACRASPGDFECGDAAQIYNYFLARKVIAYALLGEKQYVETRFC